MTLKTEEELIINKLSYKIVIDHYIKNYCTNTLILTNTETPDSIKEVTNRQSMVLDVLNLNTLKTYEKIRSNNMNVGLIVDDLKKQIFLEMCMKEDYNKAIEIAKEFHDSNNPEDIELFSLIGFKNDLKFLRKDGSIERRVWLAECLNEEMCYNLFKQRKSLVWVLFNQMNAIIHYDN